MRYPTIRGDRCADLALRLWKGEHPALGPSVEWVGEGEDVNLDCIRQAVAMMSTDLDETARDARKEEREAEAAPLLHDALSIVDVEVLDDPGFWRYLSLALFWDFIRWRETKAFARGNYLRYVDGKSSNECVLTRMYLRGAAVGGLPFAEHASVLPKATDFWRSHVVRVRTGTAPSLVRALVDMQRQHRLPTDPLRQFAKALNRTWSNVVLSIYDDDEAHALVKRIQRQVSSGGSSE